MGSPLTVSERHRMVASTHQQWLRVSRPRACAPRHKTIGPHQDGSVIRYTHFCLPAMLKIDEIAPRADPVGGERDAKRSHHVGRRLLPGYAGRTDEQDKTAI